MAIITGGRVIEGAVRRQLAGASDANDSGIGPYTSPGVPAAGYLNAVAQKGALVVNTATGVWYSNTGTLAATVWTVVGTQV